MIVAESELPRLAASFPTKVLDIQRTHVVLSGRDVFTGIDVSRDDVRQRIEQELRNLALAFAPSPRGGPQRRTRAGDRG